MNVYVGITCGTGGVSCPGRGLGISANAMKGGIGVVGALLVEQLVDNRTQKTVIRYRKLYGLRCLKMGNSSLYFLLYRQNQVYNFPGNIYCLANLYSRRMAPMNYSIQLMEEPARFVQVITSGDWERDVDNVMGLEVMQKMVELKVNKAVIDMRDLQFELRVLDIFQRVETLRDQRQKVKPSSSRVALVYRPKDTKTDDDFIFFENTARNRGLPYRVFKQMETALEWLTE
jgi:hypothetical protein